MQVEMENQWHVYAKVFEQMRQWIKIFNMILSYKVGSHIKDMVHLEWKFL